jgi:hypothetical protein
MHTSARISCGDEWGCVSEIGRFRVGASAMGVASSDNDGETWNPTRLGAGGDAAITIVGEPSVAASPFAIQRFTQVDDPTTTTDNAYYVATAIVGGARAFVLSKLIGDQPWSTPQVLDLDSVLPLGRHSIMVSKRTASNNVAVEELLVAHVSGPGTTGAALKLARYTVALSLPNAPVSLQEVQTVFDMPLTGPSDASRRIVSAMTYPVARIDSHDGQTNRYIGVELSEALPAEQVTESEDSRCSFALFFRRVGGQNSSSCPGATAWDIGGPAVCNEGSTACFEAVADRLDQWRCNARVRGVGGEAGQRARHFDIAARRTYQDGGEVVPRNEPTGQRDAAVVFAAHRVDANNREDQVWFSRFARTLYRVPPPPANPQFDCVENRAELSEPVNISDTTERCFQPTVSTIGNWLHVTWYQQDPQTLRVRLMGRASADFGRTWRPVRALSDIGTSVGATEPICPTLDPIPSRTRWSQFASSTSFIDIFYTPDDPRRRVWGSLVDLQPSNVVFYTSGRNGSDCLVQSSDEAQFQEVTSVLWRN